MARDRIPKRFRAVPQHFTSGNRVELLRDGLAAYPAMLEAIRSAREIVLLEMYWFDSDQIGRDFAHELVQAAARGVEVGVLYDAFGSIGSDPTMFAELRQAGAKVLEFGPLAPWRQRFRFGRLTRRDHRKILIVDMELGFTGGLNIADAWRSLDETGGGGWRDDVVRIQGPAVRDLYLVLLEGWALAGGRPFERAHRVEVTANPGGSQEVAVLGQSYWRGRREISRAYISQLYEARSRAYIRNAYFVPDRAVRRALKHAAERGVDVRILMPGTSDVEIVRHASRATWGTLLRSGVRLFEWQGGILHAKTAVIDGRWSTVGTYNLDHLSFRTNLEVNVSVSSLEFGAAVERSFLEDLQGSSEIDRHAFRFRPLGDRLLELIAYRFRKIL
ncbi:MAG TPA: phospholipase D-like domain-containing protein [Polyangiaceae bacterium]